MKRIELCNRTAKWGCGAVPVFFFCLSAPLVIEAPRVALLLLFLTPLALAYYVMWIDFYRSLRQVLEVTKDDVALVDAGKERWRLRWDNLALIRIAGNTAVELEDRVGTSYRYTSINLSRPVKNEILAHAPDGTKIERKELEIFSRKGRKLSATVSVALAALGAGGILWGGVGMFHAIRVTRSTNGGQVSVGMLSWRSSAMLVGAILGLVGFENLFRKPPKQRPFEGGRGELISYLRTNDLTPAGAGTTSWRLAPGREDRHRKGGRILLFALCFWGLLSGLVVVLVANEPRDWFLLPGYPLILGFHLYAGSRWLREIDGTGWVIKTNPPEIWAESEHGVYPAELRKTLGSPVLEISMDGKKRMFDPSYFVRG